MKKRFTLTEFLSPQLQFTNGTGYIAFSRLKICKSAKGFLCNWLDCFAETRNDEKMTTNLTTDEKDLTRISKFAKLTKKFNPQHKAYRVTRRTPFAGSLCIPQGAREVNKTVKDLFTYSPINLFTPNNNVSHHSPFTTHHSQKQRARRKAAFTLAEVLITLGIIGVVAAMTLPTLVQNHRKQVVETRLAKFYSVMNQAIKLSEVTNGDKLYWDKWGVGWETDEEGNEDRTKPPKALAWYNKYLKDYLKTIKVDYENTYEGKVKAYFPDGSLALLSESSIIFYPEAKDYQTVEYGENDKDRDRQMAGIKYFTFYFMPNSSNKWHHGKGVEPMARAGWDGTRDMLLNDSDIGCKQQVTNERAYCTKLIQINGWRIPNDYPLKL